MKAIHRRATAAALFGMLCLSTLLLSTLCFGEVSPSVLLSNNEECISADFLSAWTGIQVVKQNGGNSVRLQKGKKTLQMDSGCVTAADEHGVRLLPTCPIFKDGVFYVPTRAVLGAFGGNTADAPDGLRLEYAGKSTVVPHPQKPAALSGMERMRADIDDPRVALPEMAKSSVNSSRIWVYLDEFNRSVSKVQPVLKAISQSGPLSMIGRIPVVGSAVSITQYSAQCINASILASQYLAKTHQETAEPVRKAVLAADLVRRTSTASNVKSAIPVWKAADTAIEKQLRQNDGTIESTQKMVKAVKNLDAKIRERLGSRYASGNTAAIGVFSGAAERYVVRLQGSKWELSALKSYFQKLVADSEDIR